MASQNDNKNLVCPFCSLHCDDVSVTTDNNQYKVNESNNVCAKKIDTYNLNNKSMLLPKKGAKVVSLSSALEDIRNIIKGHNETLIINHGVDLSGVRSMLNFASQKNYIIDHINSKFLYQNIGVVQRTGYMATSLTEAKNRADVVMVFGNQIFDKSPRLLEKVLGAKNSLYMKKKKELILIGDFSENIIKEIKKKCNVTNVKLDLDLTNDFLNATSLDSSEAVKGLKKSKLSNIKNIINKSKYLVAIWLASDFIKAKNPKKIISSISKYIVDRNILSRSACMPISGSLADATSSQALTWTTGFSSRIKHSEGTFKHDRNAFDSKHLIDNNNVDVVIHISTISPDKLKLNKNVKNIVLGHPNTTFTMAPDIFIPVGIPGIDYEGIMFRTDNVVSVALKSIRGIKLPTTQNILDKLA